MNVPKNVKYLLELISFVYFSEKSYVNSRKVFYTINNISTVKY